MYSSHKDTHYYRCFLAVDLGAIDHNLTQLQQRMAPGVKTMAVVKADAYGHGSIPVSQHIENRVDYFAVASLYEASLLREAGIQKPIMILSYTSPVGYSKLVDLDLTATVYNLEEAKLLSDTAVSKGKKVTLHVAVDTGMARIGFAPTAESADLVKEISQLPGVTLEGLFSHYACADAADKTAKNKQTETFDQFIAMLAQRGVCIPLKHICNSAGTIEPDKQYDMCRLGIALYGFYPSEEMDREKVRLKPAMEVVSQVIHVKTVPAGTQIGYGHTYTAPEERRIATVSIGYADGFNRCLSNTGIVLIRGKRVPVVGRVCMDQIMVDVTDLEDTQVGDYVVILGKSGAETITAEELGAMSYSFNYEVVCNFMPRVKRLYYLNGEPI